MPNYPEMTTDELYAAAQEGVTDEIVKEVSRRVFYERVLKPAGMHWYDANDSLRCGFKFPDGKHCGEVISILHLNDDDFKDIPDITRPENFWPLFEKLMGKEYSIFKTVIGYVVATEYEAPELYDHGIRHKIPGLAIAFAYLKIMEEK